MQQITRSSNGAPGFGVVAGLSAALFLAAPATAGFELPDGFDIFVSSELGDWALSNNLDDFSWIPDDLGGGTVQQEPNSSAGVGWMGDFAGTGFAAGSTSVFGNFSLTNTTGQTQTFTVTVQSPLIQPLLGQTFISGSISGSMVDSGGGGAEVTAPSGGSIYTAFVDGNAVRTLLDDPFSQTAPVGGTNTIGPASFSNEMGPFNATMSAAIQHTFTLTPGDGVTFSSAFHIVPAPGAIAVFALAGVIGTRRRRN